MQTTSSIKRHIGPRLSTVRIPLLLLVLAGNLHAEQFEFWINRFGSIKVSTSKQSATAVLTQGNKQGEAVMWQGVLKAVDQETFVSKGGTTFKITKQAKKVVNDPNRGINSGSYKLVISGKGKDYEAIKKEMVPVTFGAGNKTECYGDKLK